MQSVIARIGGIVVSVLKCSQMLEIAGRERRSE